MDKKAGLSKRLNYSAMKKLGPTSVLDLLLRSGDYGGGANVFKGLTLNKLKAQPHGVDLGPLEPALPQALFHHDKRIHLRCDFFMADLKRLDAYFFGNDRTSEPPRDETLLIGRRHVRSNNSWLHNSRRLVKGKPRCTLMLHPEDAAQRGISEGQQVRVSARVGSITIAAEITDTMMPGVVSIPHGWGHNSPGTQWSTAQEHAGVSVNDLTDEMAVDELSGNAVLNGVPVQLEAVAG